MTGMPFAVASLEGSKHLDSRLVWLLLPLLATIRKDATNAELMSRLLCYAQAQDIHPQFLNWLVYA